MAGRLAAWANVTRILLALLLLAGLPLPATADEAKPVAAIVLVARDELPDPDFRDSKVLVMNNIGPLPAGVILNRPTRLTVARLFPELKRLAQVRDKVYFGGPVDMDSVWFVFASPIAQEHAVQIVDGVYVSADDDLLHELLARDKPMANLRIFIGHSVWGPGQLENEIGRGDWSLVPAGKDAIFNGKPEHPWPSEPEPEGTHRT